MRKQYLLLLLLIGTPLTGVADGVNLPDTVRAGDVRLRQGLQGTIVPTPAAMRRDGGDVGMDSILAGYPPQEERPLELRMDVYPHPVRGVATLRMFLEPSDAQRPVRVQILTMAGTVVGEVYDDVPAAERLEIPLPAASTAGLSAGMYFLVAHTASGRTVLSIVVA